MSVLALLCLLPVDPEVIQLKTGQTVTGEVLKETEQDLIVDLGVDVLRVPRDRVESRTVVDEAAATDEVTTGELYRVATDLPPRSVRELVEQRGPGVVLVSTPGGLGSGWIISERGHCVTNFHVVEGATRISATILLSGDETDVTRRRIDDVQILALNPFLDLALLQIPTQDDFAFTTTPLAPDDTLREGQEVFAIGNPLGLERSVSQGIVSTRARSFEGITYIQTTADINPGNSGGPLFDMRGRVVGVTNMKLLGGEGLGFAIPISYVKHFLRHRESFAYDRNQPNTGYRYLDAPARKNFGAPPLRDRD